MGCLFDPARAQRAIRRLVGGPDIDNKIRLERQHRFKVCRITAPGNAPNFRPPADVRQHVSALFWTVGARPAEQQIGRKRVQQDGGWRAGGKYALDACLYRYGPTGTVFDDCSTRSTRYQQTSLADHHGGSLDDRPSIITHPEIKIGNGLVGNRGRDDDATANIDANMGRRGALRHIDNLSLELIACAEFHRNPFAMSKS